MLPHGGRRTSAVALPEFVRPGRIPSGRNLEQQFFMDALLDEGSTDHVLWQGGHGEDALSTACALHRLRRERAVRRRAISSSSPRKDIGFLPAPSRRR